MSEHIPQHANGETALPKPQERPGAHSLLTNGLAEVKGLNAVRKHDADAQNTLDTLAKGKLPYGWDERFLADQHEPEENGPKDMTILQTTAQAALDAEKRTTKWDGKDGFKGLDVFTKEYKAGTAGQGEQPVPAHSSSALGALGMRQAATKGQSAPVPTDADAYAVKEVVIPRGGEGTVDNVDDLLSLLNANKNPDYADGLAQPKSPFVGETTEALPRPGTLADVVETTQNTSNPDARMEKTYKLPRSAVASAIGGVLPKRPVGEGERVITPGARTVRLYMPTISLSPAAPPAERYHATHRAAPGGAEVTAQLRVAPYLPGEKTTDLDATRILSPASTQSSSSEATAPIPLHTDAGAVTQIIRPSHEQPTVPIAVNRPTNPGHY